MTAKTSTIIQTPYSSSVFRKALSGLGTDYCFTMYDQDYTEDPYQGSLTSPPDDLEQIGHAPIEDMALQQADFDYARSATNFTPQQQYLANHADMSYTSYSLPQYPQTWLPLDHISSEPTGIENEHQTMYQTTQPRHGSLSLPQHPSLTHSLSKSSSEGGVSGASEDRQYGTDVVGEKKRERKEVS